MRIYNMDVYMHLFKIDYHQLQAQLHEEKITRERLEKKEKDVEHKLTLALKDVHRLQTESLENTVTIQGMWFDLLIIT